MNNKALEEKAQSFRSSSIQAMDKIGLFKQTSDECTVRHLKQLCVAVVAGLAALPAFWFGMSALGVGLLAFSAWNGYASYRSTVHARFFAEQGAAFRKQTYPRAE